MTVKITTLTKTIEILILNCLIQDFMTYWKKLFITHFKSIQFIFL